ncbi:GDSL esterase/lipase At5g03810 [Linum perenne]
MGVVVWGASLLVLALFSLMAAAVADPLVPSLTIFGDSVADVGNNNHLITLIRANFHPYGRDFADHRPTGRFSNGKLAIDITADFLGFNSYPPPYLSQEAENLGNVVTGVNFASGASGLLDRTAHLYVNYSTLAAGAVSLSRQLENYKEYRERVESKVGTENSSDIFSKGIHLLSTGTSDFIQNYYVNPVLRALYTPDQFSDKLMKSYATFIQNLYGLGARRIGVTSLPPTGCLPAAITLFGFGSNECVERLNWDATSFNQKLNTTSQSIVEGLPGLKIVVFDIYNPLLNLIKNPSDNGFVEARKACCGTGVLETAFLCNAMSPGTCSNATEYVFWDGFHPSEAANNVLAQAVLSQGFSLIS